MLNSSDNFDYELNKHKVQIQELIESAIIMEELQDKAADIKSKEFIELAKTRQLIQNKINKDSKNSLTESYKNNDVNDLSKTIASKLNLKSWLNQGI